MKNKKAEGIDIWQLENANLKKELAQNKRELEIEASLERVRARAMAMQNSEELKELIGTVFTELTKLNLALTRCLIMIFDPETKGSMWWMANSEEPSSPKGFYVKYHKQTPYLAYIKTWLEKQLKWQYILEGTEKKEWDNVLFSETELSQLPGYVIDGMKAPDRVILSASFNNFGCLSVASLEPLSAEHFDLLLRFAKVFDLTYTRFNDLKKAEAQAREAEIQASLERVRASAMAMHKSEELLDVCETMFKEFLSLGLDEIRNAFINIHNDADHSFVNYDFAEVAGKSVNRFTNDVLPFVSKMMKASHSANDAFSETHLKGKSLTKFRNLREQSGQKDEPRLNKAKSLYFYAYSIGIGAIGISTYGSINTEKKAFLKRFRDVFDLSYKRYIDISKAEAQAREAEIELALERVRARTMAMQKSDELKEVVSTLSSEIGKLDFIFDRTSIVIYEPDSLASTWWMSNPETKESFGLFVQYHKNKPYQEHIKAWRKRKESWEYILEGEDKKEWDKFLFYKTELSILPDHVKNHMQGREKVSLSCSFSNFGYLVLESVRPLTHEQFNILFRFAKVFDQTYTRFLDLQKAEAQAREAQIEAALERVRSKSMAMHHTSELQDVINTVHKQLKGLDIAITGGAFIAINEEIKNELACWGAGGTADYVERVHIPIFDRPIYKGLIKGIKKGPGFFTEAFSNEEKVEFFKHLFKNPPYKETSTKRKKEIMSRQGGYTRSCCVSKYTSIFMINHHGEKFTDQDNDILKRFGIVFEQTYTRFLDLQKAEAQAQEAQIEAALEKVRSRSLAMRQSSELTEVATVLFEKLFELGIVKDEVGGNASIFLYDDPSKGIDQYVASDPGLLSSPEHFHLPYCDHPIMTDVLNAKESGVDFFAKTYSFEEKNTFLKWSFEFSDYKRMPDHVKMFLLECKSFSRTDAFSKHSSLFIPSYTGQNLSEKEIDTLKRFATVFDQAYVRFLDLQKAEAQAREAEIQLALERVRARTMAMQKSEELLETALLIRRQFSSLVELPEKIRMVISILNDETKNFDLYITTTEGSQLNRKFSYSIDEPYVFHPAYLAVKNKKKTFIIDLSGKSLSEYAAYLENIGFPVTFRDRALITCATFSNGYFCLVTADPVSNQILQLLTRFADGFDLTYTRFLDLQKAEEQAREAEIQLALERVRAKTMAMHKSEELQDVASLLYNEFQGLGVTSFLNCGYVEVDEKNNIQYGWMTSPDGTFMEKFNLPLTGEPAFQARYEAWKNQEPVYHQVIGGSALVKHIKVASRHFGSEEVEKMVRSQFPDPTIFYCGNFSKGYLHLVTGNLLTTDEESLLDRFTRAFEMTYNRFLDLQKAEAQAREAEIQLALERVRARTMAMHNSNELAVTVALVYEQLSKLGFDSWSYLIRTRNQGRDGFTTWLSFKEMSSLPEGYYLPRIDHPIHKKIMKGWDNQLEYEVIEFSGEQKKQYDELLFTKTDWKKLPASVKKAFRTCFSQKSLSFK